MNDDKSESKTEIEKRRHSPKQKSAIDDALGLWADRKTDGLEQIP